MARRPFVDRVLGAVGLQRQSSARRYRVSGAWQGADSNRFTASWMTPTSSINLDLRYQLPTLRSRARWLVENNGYCAGFARCVEDNLIGPKGVQLRGAIRTKTGAFATATNHAIEEAFTRWGGRATCDVARRLTWLDTQRLVARTVAIDGECFIRIIRGASNAFGFALQILDTDLVDDSYHVAASAGQHEIRMGVELDAWGGAVAYHVLTSHPAEHASRERMRIVADDMLHLFVPLRAGQVRGVPWLAPVLTDAQMLDGYEEAELIGARTAATSMGLLKPNENAALDANSPIDTQFSAEPGQFRELPYGYDVEQWTPQQPSASFSAFVESILRCIARGAGVTYMSLTGDLTNANYSSLRAGQAPERDAWRALHQWLIPRLHAPTYEAWLPYALLADQIAVDSRLASTYQTVTWKGRGWVSVDPLKDIQAWERKIRLGVGSRTKMLAEEGEDFEDMIDELRDEMDYAMQERVDIAGVDAMTPVVPGATDTTSVPAVVPDARSRPVMRGLRSLASRVRA